MEMPFALIGEFEFKVFTLAIDFQFRILAGVPGEKPKVTSDKVPDSPSKFPCIQL